EHGDMVARARAHAREQRDVALEPGHQHRLAGLGQAQLAQRADAVGIAVEHVVVGHAGIVGGTPQRVAARATGTYSVIGPRTTSSATTSAVTARTAASNSAGLFT